MRETTSGPLRGLAVTLLAEIATKTRRLHDVGLDRTVTA